VEDNDCCVDDVHSRQKVRGCGSCSLDLGIGYSLYKRYSLRSKLHVVLANLDA
jgi:hypothetical protein